jgi:hypothetical protein
MESQNEVRNTLWCVVRRLEIFSVYDIAWKARSGSFMVNFWVRKSPTLCSLSDRQSNKAFEASYAVELFVITCDRLNNTSYLKILESTP